MNERPSIKSFPPIRDLLLQSFDTCKKNIYEFFILSVISLVVYVAIGIIAVGVIFATGIGGAGMEKGMQGALQVPGAIAILASVLLIMVVFAIIFGFALQAAYILIAAGEKKDLSYVDLLKKGVLFVPSLLWISLLTFFIISGSLFVFILPAIFVGFLFTFVVYEIVLSGNRGIHALGRSVYIVTQHFFPIVGRILFLIIAGLFISIPASATRELVSDNSILVLVVFIISVVVNALWSWFTIVYSVLLYKQAKEAVDPHKTSDLLWMWIVGGIGWLIAIGILYTVLLV